MITKIIPIRELLPIELNCHINSLRALKYSRDSQIFNPIPVVRANIHPNISGFITGDGHTRTLSRLIRGEEEVEVEIMETDRDIICSPVGAFNYYVSLNEFIDTYRKHWRPLLLKEGIRSFYDYKLLKKQGLQIR